MRSLLISTALFLICAALMITNSVLLHNYTHDMLDKIDTLPRDVNLSAADTQSDALRTLDELSVTWYEYRDMLSLTVTFDYIAAVTLALNSTREFCESNISGEYLAGVEALRESVTRLHELESFSWHNIL